MKYYIVAKESRRKKDGKIAVRILFRDMNGEFTVSTGISVSTPFSGLKVPTEEPNYRSKTKRLNNIIDNIESYILNSCGVDFRKRRRELISLVTNETYEEKKMTLADYMERFAESKSRKGTQGIYMNTVKKVRKFDAAATFEGVDKTWLDGFCKSMGNVSTNYLSINLRNIRTVFNWAIDNEITKNYPFRRYRIKSEKVRINNVTLGQLREIRDFPLNDRREIYRDLFMLTFYLCGINPVDLLSLKKTDMRSGRIHYKRAKTGRLYDIPVTPEANKIINKYKGKNFLLCPLDIYADYKTFCNRWNYRLKKLGPVKIVPDKVGKMRKHEWHPIAEGLTIYSARYTFASIGAELEIPRETIALCLGHSWADVTSHYIAYDLKRIDEAVRKITAYVNEDLKK